MPFKKYSDLPSKLVKNQLSKAYYIWGEEHLLQEEFVNNLQKALAQKTDRAVFYGNGFDIDEFMSTIASMSLFSEEKVTIVKDANKLKAATVKLIVSALGAGNFTPYIIFINPLKLRRDELYSNLLIKTISNIGDVVEFRPLYPNECINFIINEFKNNNKTIAYPDAEYLYQLSGNNLFDIKNEVEKLLLFTKENPKVESKDIFECSGFIKQENIYQFTDVIINNDKRKALELVDNLLNSGSEYFHLYSLLYRTYRKMIMAIDMANKNVPTDTIMKKLRVYDRNFVPKVKKFKMADIVKKMEVLLETELAVKSGKIENPDLRTVIAELI